MSSTLYDTIEFYNSAPVPANSGHSYVYDSTKWNDIPWVAGTASAAPGKSRGQLKGRRVTGTVTPVTQDITLVFEILTNPDGTTSAAWEQDVNGPGGGSVAVTAGTTQPYSWLPFTGDHRIRIAAGATAPSAIRTETVMSPHRTSGA